MLGKSLASVGMPELQKAVMGMDPRIKPFEALAELQTRVKREKMKQSMQAQNPQQQPVAQQALAEAASLQNPYMSGLASAPVESPVGMAGGGIVAFEEGGHIPRYNGRTSDGSYVNLGGVSAVPYYMPGASSERDRLNALPGVMIDEFGNLISRGWDRLTAGTTIEAQRKEKAAAKAKQEKEANTPKYDAATQEKGTAALEAMRDLQVGDATKVSDKPNAGLAAAAAQGAGGAPTARVGAGAAGVGLGSIPSAYDTGFAAQSDEDRIASMQKYKKAMGAQNEEFLKPLSERLSKYESEVAEGKKGAMADALVQAGLGMLAGKSQYALQNIGEGGAAGLAALRESKKADRAAQEKLLTAQSDMAKSRIALEKGDEQTAASLANQARQEQQAGAQFKLLGQHYANQDRASQLQAQAYLARANAMGGVDKSALTQFQAGKLADMAGDNVQKFMDSSAGMQALITARAEAKSAGVPFDAMKFRSDLVRQEMQRLQQTMGGSTMPAQASPAGGGSGARFLGFE
jgi:hypothetical protein